HAPSIDACEGSMMKGDGRSTELQPLNRSMSPHGDMHRRSLQPRVLLVTPQPFFEERGTPIAVALAARALVESGLKVDVLAFPIGVDPHIEGVSVERCANPLGFTQVRVGFSLRKACLDVSLLQAL